MGVVGTRVEFGQPKPNLVRRVVLGDPRLPWVLLALLVLMVAGSLYQRIVVDPQLTGLRLELGMSPRSDQVRIAVDRDRGLVVVTGGQLEISGLVVFEEKLFVLASEVEPGIAQRGWAAVPLAELDGRFGALRSDRVVESLSRDVKRCGAPGSDGMVVLELLLTRQLGDDEFSVCGWGVGGATDEGLDVLVRSDRIRPESVRSPVIEAAVPVLEPPERGIVLDWLNGLLESGRA